MGERAVLAILVAALIAVLSLSPLGDRIERDGGLATLYALRGPVEPPPGAVLLLFDAPSASWLQRNADRLDRVAPRLDRCLTPEARDELARTRSMASMPRAVHACLVRRLHALGTRLIVFDVNFGLALEDDRILADALAETGRTLLFERVAVPDTGAADSVIVRRRPAKILQDAALGTVGFHVERVFGRMTTRYLTQFEAFPDLPVMPIEAYRQVTGRTPALPLFDLIHYYGPTGTIRSATLRDAFDPDRAVPPLAGQVVFVGAALDAPTVNGDGFLVPTFGGDARLMSGVEIAATVFLNLSNDDRLVRPGPEGSALLAGFASLAMIGIALRVRRAWVAAALLAALAATLAGGAALAFAHNLWLPVAVPLAVALPVALLIRLERRLRVTSRVARAVVPRQFLDDLLQGGSGRRRTTEASAMFVDIAGSTGLAERLGAEPFAALIASYYARVGDAVEAHGGVVIETRGDGVLALFAADQLGANYAAAACDAALAMMRTLPRETGDGLPALSVRIGIASGETVAGAVAIGRRLSIAATGDPVHVAARLQEIGKRQIAQDAAPSAACFMDRATAEMAPRAATSFSLDRTEVLRGRRGETQIYRLLPETVNAASTIAGTAGPSGN